MKKSFPKLVAILTLLIISYSCSSDDHDHDVEVNQIPDLKTALISGDWIVSHYATKFGSDETLNYSGFSLSFLDNGILSATDGSLAYTGSWSVTEEVHATNADLNHVHLNILFSEPEEFVEISDDWDVRKFNGTVIEVDAVLASENGTRTLTITKK